MRSLLLTLLPFVAAWPEVMQMTQEYNANLQKRADVQPRQPTFLSGRPNTGALHNPPAPFDPKDQYVNVKAGTEHEFRPPVKGDQRGQCPGLNAAANHGFLPRNGLPTIAQTTTGLAQAYGLAEEVSLGLAVIAIALGGDPIKQTWSIGGAFQNTIPLFPASGILGTHNQYEGDASIIRGDAYLNNGNVGVFQNFKWDYLMNQGDSFTLDSIANQSDYNTRWSIANNPYYFSAPFSGIVVPAAHNFVVNFMSNRSAEHPGGILTPAILQSFFSVTGTKNNYKHTPGLERIPDNWYRRSSSQKYNIADVFADVLVNNAMYPGTLRFGGNTGTVNSFTGIEIGDFTEGLFNLETLGEGNNGACFLLQAASAVLPDASDPLVDLGTTLFGWVASQLGPLTSKYGCPQLKQINSTPIFKKFPGASYKASGIAKRFHA